jgi:hypothetical protein
MIGCRVVDRADHHDDGAAGGDRAARCHRFSQITVAEERDRIARNPVRERFGSG